MKLPSYSTDIGLLILRVGIGVMFIFHGIPKLLGGTAAWEGLGAKGVPFIEGGIIAITLGFIAMAIELLGGIALALGKFHRIACAGLASVMFVAATTKIGDVNGINDFAFKMGWPLELLIVFVALFFTGPGRIKAGGKPYLDCKRILFN